MQRGGLEVNRAGSGDVGPWVSSPHRSSRRSVVRALLVALPIVAAIVAGCSSASRSATDGNTGTTAAPEDIVLQASDFVSLKDMTAVRGFFVANRLGHLDEALAVANDPSGGTYPVGTVIQLVPQEAMVKRAPGFDAASDDWEFF